MTKSVTIAARVDADLDGQLDRLAAATGRSKSWLISEALRSYIANEQQFLASKPCGTARRSIMRRSSRPLNGSSARVRDDQVDATGE
jgi:predicted transcriptional regulator